ncbi:MAG: biopolymer transport protein ExbD [Chthoniobacter sp.]|jgi:biopolymer transport protein ExbD|nr:biopolymer transport protein ExbD [Chthoniobacter sp.]
MGSEDGDIGFQIAPMVDVVFVLMLFFMAMAGSQVKERELNIALPSGAPAKGPNNSKTPIVIDISPEGQVSMNNEVYGAPTDKGLNRLREWLKATIEQFGTEDPVIIRPQSDTKHERIVDVLNAAAYAGVKNLTFS